MMGRMMNPSQSMMQTNWSNHQFPPTPPPSIPPTLPYLPPSRQATPPCSPTIPCPPTQLCSPGAPSVPSSQPRPHETIPSTSPKGLGHHEATRTYGFDLNPHWQEDRDHYDNQKINGLTFPRTIRQSAFTQKLDIEGCDPLALPLAALMYQQANNFWLRKLAHGREVYLIPTGEIATVVFITEPLTQLRSRGADLDRVSHSRARQDGKLLDKTNNTKYAAQQIAVIIHSCLPARTTDPDTQHEITQLRNQLADLRQRAGEDPGDNSTPPRVHRHLLILPAFWSALPRSIHGWLNTCQPPWLCELSPNGSKNFHCLSQRGKSSLKTLPRPKLGGHISRRKPVKLSNEWLS